MVRTLNVLNLKYERLVHNIITQKLCPFKFLAKLVCCCRIGYRCDCVELGGVLPIPCVAQGIGPPAPPPLLQPPLPPPPAQPPLPPQALVLQHSANPLQIVIGHFQKDCCRWNERTYWRHIAIEHTTGWTKIKKRAKMFLTGKWSPSTYGTKAKHTQSQQ